MKQTEILTHGTHVNGWFPAVYMSCMSQNFRLFHVSNLSVRNFRIFLLMYMWSVTTSRFRLACSEEWNAPACGADQHRRSRETPRLQLKRSFLIAQDAERGIATHRIASGIVIAIVTSIVISIAIGIAIGTAARLN